MAKGIGMWRHAALVIVMGGMLATGAAATEHARSVPVDQIEVPKGLFIPEMNAERGRALFAETGCVVCHAVNDVGGHHTPLDAATMESPMNAFEFATKMWRGAEPMIFLQREDLGYVIDLSGQELADIIAFVHDAEEQRKFSLDDIPPEVLRLMDRDEHDDHHHGDGRPHAH